jgi:hypothetical protein
MKTCQNCQQPTPKTVKVKGYDVCRDCEAKASLPWHQRG